ncbi:alpha-crystallin B chain-like [Cimex lectularius]|uniref:SHSP domain-containing protein n=1 Tax=Cimex lectularius TaxID=79782 RepID=A0A8I6RPP7_CIMLE|nr:alpha-crystallin B chain-like [Cimex lectularius]
MLRVFQEAMAPSRVLIPLRTYARTMSRTTAPKPKEEDKEFKLELDVSRFRPEELKVTVDNDLIIIDGSHEERSTHGYVSRQFTRMFKVPNGVDVRSLVSNLTSDGVLSLKAPIKVVEPTTWEIPITHVKNGEVNSSNSKPEEPKKS